MFSELWSPKVKLYLDSLCQDETTKLRTQSMELKRRRVDADLVLSSSDEGWKRLWDVQRFVTCKTRAGNHRHSCQASSQSRYILHVKVPLFAAHLALVSWLQQLRHLTLTRCMQRPLKRSPKCEVWIADPEFSEHRGCQGRRVLCPWKMHKMMPGRWRENI